jgi:hypothetical protein
MHDLKEENRVLRTQLGDAEDEGVLARFDVTLFDQRSMHRGQQETYREPPIPISVGCAL